MLTDSKLHLVEPGARPAYYLVAEHLWGSEANIDSDGDSASPEDTQWTELSLRLRDSGQYSGVHVDLVSNNPLVLEIRSSDDRLVRRVAEYLRDRSGGTIRENIAQD